MENESTQGPYKASHTTKVHVINPHNEFEVYGVDATWWNVYRGDLSDFTMMRVQYDCTIEALIAKVGKHVQEKWYQILSINASTHHLNVVMILEKNWAELPENFFGAD